MLEQLELAHHALTELSALLDKLVYALEGIEARAREAEEADAPC